jgi:structural maintenance of chromosome 2
LGITNLSQVRAGNLHELVYKQGQAGVNKAVVTIVFDNSDPNTSPVGYESSTEVSVTRQVLIGGKSKYLINGHTAQAGQVQNLFHSVQLNVNNPHFLIMQGRITKVLNMKPVEILGMVEEAAGTRMYETKKQSAMKTIDKKQLKVDELNSVLNEEITPTLERLRGEKQHYLKWSKNNADIERIERFCVAYDFSKCQKTLSTSKEEVVVMKGKIEDLNSKAAEHAVEVTKRNEGIETIKLSMSGELEEEVRIGRSQSSIAAGATTIYPLTQPFASLSLLSHSSPLTSSPLTPHLAPRSSKPARRLRRISLRTSSRSTPPSRTPPRSPRIPTLPSPRPNPP